jgi:hypothetical protein
MDIALITAAYDGLKIAKDVFSGYNNLKNKADSIEKVNEAVRKVGDPQDDLFQLREEPFRLQEENNNLKQLLSIQEEWNTRIQNYELVEADGSLSRYFGCVESGHSGFYTIYASCQGDRMFSEQKVVFRENHPIGWV